MFISFLVFAIKQEKKRTKEKKKEREQTAKHNQGYRPEPCVR